MSYHNGGNRNRPKDPNYGSGGVRRGSTARIQREPIDPDKQMKEALYTSGGEFTLPNGRGYVGYYHIHPEQGAMVGRYHSTRNHDALEPIVRDGGNDEGGNGNGNGGEGFDGGGGGNGNGGGGNGDGGGGEGGGEGFGGEGEGGGEGGDPEEPETISKSHYSGETIAFSHNGGFWKTRYSFTPTCYGVLDNIMVSANGTSPFPSSEGAEDLLFWEHPETNIVHNQFYGRTFPSKVSVVSNQDPSSVKIFKSISLESDSGKWRGMCSTNINSYLGENADEIQMGTIEGFTRKEGTEYSELPRSVVNSESHIDFACIVSEIITEDTVYTPLTNYTASQTDYDAVAPNYFIWEVDIEQAPNTSISGGRGTIALFQVGDLFSYFNLSGEVFEYDFSNPSAYSLAISHNAVHVHRCNSSGYLTFGGRVPENWDNSALPALMSNFTMNPPPGFDETTRASLFVVSNPNVNGDAMRGHYLYLDLVCNLDASHEKSNIMELFAINVDYESTKLDAAKIRKAAKQPTAKKTAPKGKK
jgi:hypothetical protein